jgi:hypothetical protein
MTDVMTTISAPVVVPNVPTRAQIEEAERALAAHPGRLDDLPVVHHFAPGMYARELHIPAGVMLTGKIHKTRHMNVLSAGEITVWTEDGMQRLSAPFSFESQPGTKRIGYAHTDCVWTTYHFTFETDLDAIEAEVIEPSDNLLGVQDMKVLK